MIVEICKEFRFDAAHHLPLVPDGHKCKRLHGHTYAVEVYLEGPIGEDGMLVDYADIAEAMEPILAQLDHYNLNDIPGLENPTTENLVVWVWERIDLPYLSRVTIQESSTTSCSYYGFTA